MKTLSIVYPTPRTALVPPCLFEDGTSVGDWPGKSGTDRITLLHVLWLRYAKVMTRQEIAEHLDVPVMRIDAYLTEILVALDEIDPEKIT